MPHTESAKKRLRQTIKRNERNRFVKKGIKLQLKNFYDVIAHGNQEQRQAEFKLACKKLDKAAARNIIHKNTAARKKSQLAIMLAKAPEPKKAAE